MKEANFQTMKEQKMKKGTTHHRPFPFQHYVREKISYSQDEAYVQ